MLDFKKKKILILSPHPEDGEIVCGGLIQRFLKNKSKCWYVCFTNASQSVKPPFKPNAQTYEMYRSTSILGIKKNFIIQKNYEVRSFNKYRQDILHELYLLNKKIKPDLVLCHSRQDTHQDHETITKEAIRAFKKTSILGYELPWNHFNFSADLYINLTKKECEIKCEALRSYKSRMYRPYLSKKRQLEILGMRGLQIEKDYAESYEVIRMIS